MRPDGFQRLLDTNRTTDGYAHVISPTSARYASVKAMKDAGLAVMELGQKRGCLAKIIGRGSADNAVINCRVYLAFYNRGGSTDAAANNAGISHIDLMYAGLLAATLSNTRVGQSGGTAQPAADVAADGLTWTAGDSTTTPKGPLDKLYEAHGSINTPKVFSPADDIMDALFAMADCFDADAIVFDLDLHTNATQANVLACRTN